MLNLNRNFDEDISTSIELSYRRYLIKVCMVVALPTLIAFGVRDFIIGRYFIGLILSSMVVILVGIFLYIRKPQIKIKKNLIYDFF